MKYRYRDLAATAVALAFHLSMLFPAGASPIHPGPASPRAGAAVLLSEDFEGGDLPDDWAVDGDPGWQFDNPAGRANTTGGAGRFAIADSDAAGGDMDTELRTPALDLSGYTVVTLTFKTDFKYYGEETASVDLSLDGGATWPRSLWRKQGANARGAVTVLLPPDAVGKPDVMLRFQYAGASSAWYWQVDEVRVTASAGNLPPVAPGPITFGAVAAGSIVVQWSDNSTNETGFRLERSLDSSTGWMQIAAPGANVAQYADSGLTCNTAYAYRVRAYNAAGASAYSAVARTTTGNCPPVPPGAPAELAVVSAGTTQLGLRWAGPVTNTAGFKLERSPDGSTGWAHIGAFAAGATTGADGNVPCGSTRYYRLRAYNAAGDSGYSNTASGQTLACPPLTPAAPAGLTVTAVTSAAVGLAWTDGSADETGFKIDRSPNGADGWTQAGETASGITAFADSGLACATPYWYRVRAYNANGASTPSNVTTAVTGACPPPPPAAPSDLAAPAAKQTEVALRWTDPASGTAGFKIERSADGSTGWAQIAAVDPGVTAYANTGLACNTRYSYRVRASNANGDSPYSNAVDAMTAACTPVLTSLDEPFNSPSRPAGWVITPASGAAAWAFDDPAQRTNQTGGSGPFASVDSDRAGRVAIDAELRAPPLNLSAHTVVKLMFKTLFMTDGTSTADVDVSLNSGATWTNLWRQTGADYQGGVTLDVPQAAGQANVQFRFHYYNAAFAWYWQVDDVRVPDALAAAAPAAPGGLAARIAGVYVSLGWTRNSSNETNFIVERSPDGAAWVEAGRTEAGATSFTHRNVACDTTVHYRVKAVNAQSESGPSNVVRIATPVCPTAAVSLAENFDAGLNWPAGWIAPPGQQGGRWVITSSHQVGTSGNAAHAGWWQLEDMELRAPVLDFSGVEAAVLKFRTYVNLQSMPLPGITESVRVDISRDGGGTWNTVWRRDDEYSYRGLVVVDVSAYAAGQASVMARFVSSRLCLPGSGWDVDDVEIKPMPAPQPPATLTATLTGGGEVLLAWGEADSVRYLVERSAGDGVWAQIADLSYRTTTMVDDSVASFAAYQYRVRAYNPIGKSGYTAPISITAGDTRIRYVDVTVSLYPTAAITTPAGRARYESILGYFAEGVYEVSNGAHRLRKVTLYRDGSNADTANIRWQQSVARPSAMVNGYRGGGRINMADNTALAVDPNCEYCNRQQAGYGDLTHEWGHYFYGLYDEYREPGRALDPDLPNRPADPDVSSRYSIMNEGDVAADWYSKVLGRMMAGDLRWLNFSARTSDFSTRTAQMRMYGADAWTTLARSPRDDPRIGGLPSTRLYWPELAAAAPAPGVLPRIDLTQTGGYTQARAALQVVWAPGFTARDARRPGAGLAAANGVVREIVIDRSALMAGSGYLDAAKAAVAALIRQAPEGDALGLITFDGAAAVAQPLTDIDGPAGRDALAAAVKAISAGGEGSAPGTALQAALAELTAPGVPADTTRVVYLITAGRHTAGPAPIILAPGFEAEDIAVYTFGFDPAGDSANLRQVADRTGGSYTPVRHARDLERAFDQADEDTSPGSDVTLTAGETGVSAGETFTVPVEVDDSLGEVAFEITYDGEADAADLALIDPAGVTRPITPDTQCDTSGAGEEAETTCWMSVTGAPGRWMLRAQAVDDMVVTYAVSGSTREGQMPYDASMRATGGGVAVYPQPIALEATVDGEYPIAGLTVEGTVCERDGNELDIEFRDDGAAPDRIANDGVYAAYADYTHDGEVRIAVHFSNPDGAAHYTARGVMDAVQQAFPPLAQRFERYAETDVEVQGWQEDDHADWPGDPGWPPTPLALDNQAAAGRIDFAGDVDVFAITVPAGYTGTLGVRIDRLGLGMDPLVTVYDEGHAWEFERWRSDTASIGDALFAPIDAQPGETIYVEVQHADGAAETGVYSVSAGPYLWSDPIAKEKQRCRVYLPLVRR